MSIYNDIFYIIIILNMNFIIRNLGWILLIIFFVFMLYLISNQNNTKDTNLIEGTGVVVEQSELIEEIIPEVKIEEEDVIEQIEVVKKVELESEKNLDSKEDSYINELAKKIDVVSGEAELIELDSSTGWILNSIRNFFTIKKVDTSTGVVLTATWEVTKDLIKEVETELNNKEMVVEEVIIEEPTKEVAVKKQEKKSILDFSFGKKKEVNTWIVGELNDILGLDTTKKKEKREEVVQIIEVKKEAKVKEKKVEASEQSLATYEIWVKSMFLNNAWFTKRTGVLYKWDTVEQLTRTNKYGCFQIKVLSSSNSDNNWKIAWACKYYMIGHQGSLNSYKTAANEYYRSMNKTVSKSIVKKSVTKYIKTSAKNTSKVWTIHSVKTHSLKLNNKSFTKTNAYLLKWDKVEQLTNTNASGCFKVSVYSSTNTTWGAQGKSGWVCQKYLK